MQDLPKGVLTRGLLEPTEAKPVPKGLHQANRQKLISLFKAKNPALASENSVILFKGSPSSFIHESDADVLPHQEAIFSSLFGSTEGDLYGIIEIKSGKAVLLPARLDPAYKIWMTVPDHAYFKNLYDVDDVVFLDEVEQYLEKLQPSCIYLPTGSNVAHGKQVDTASFEWLSKFKVDKKLVYPRVIESLWQKTAQELEVLRYAYSTTAEAHRNILQSASPGIYEFQIEALFRFEIQSRIGSRFLTAQPVISSGKKLSALYYFENNQQIQDGSLVIMDMGAKYHGYCSDITTTFPINGKFNTQQRQVYDLLVETFRFAQSNIKPSQHIEGLHQKILDFLMKGLEKLGVLLEGKTEKAFDNLLCPHLTVFPSGLSEVESGHDTETAENLKASDPKATNLTYMWPKLKAGMIVTVAVGLYFDPAVIKAAIDNDEDAARGVDQAKLNQFVQNVGGARIERQLVLTANGAEELVPTPLTSDQVEACIRGQAWNSK